MQWQPVSMSSRTSTTWDTKATTPMPASVRLWHGLADYSGLSVNAPVLTRLLQSMKERGTMLDATLIQVDIAGARAEADPGRPDSHSIRSWSFAIARRAHELGVPFVAGTNFMDQRSILFLTSTTKWS